MLMKWVVHTSYQVDVTNRKYPICSTEEHCSTRTQSLRSVYCVQSDSQLMYLFWNPFSSTSILFWPTTAFSILMPSEHYLFISTNRKSAPVILARLFWSLSAEYYLVKLCLPFNEHHCVFPTFSDRIFCSWCIQQTIIIIPWPAL